MGIEITSAYTLERTGVTLENLYVTTDARVNVYKSPGLEQKSYRYFANTTFKFYADRQKQVLETSMKNYEITVEELQNNSILDLVYQKLKAELDADGVSYVDVLEE